MLLPSGREAADQQRDRTQGNEIDQPFHRKAQKVGGNRVQVNAIERRAGDSNMHAACATRYDEKCQQRPRQYGQCHERQCGESAFGPEREVAQDV